MRRLLVGVLSLAACGSRRSPPLDPESFLAVGVDPRAECDAERDALRRDGLVVVRRIDQPGICALGLASPDGHHTAVRVVTGRGVQLARDGVTDGIPPAPPVTLVALPSGMPTSREVLVGRGDPRSSRTCVEVVRVLADDTAQVVAVELEAITDRVPLAADLCVEEIRDVDGDGRVEALVPVRLRSLSPPSSAAAERLPPTVSVPLAARGDALGPALALPDYWRGERARRAASLARARAELDVEGVYTLAVELAAIALLSGQGREPALAVYDDALRGLVLTEPQAGFVAATRDRVARGLRSGPR